MRTRPSRPPRDKVFRSDSTRWAILGRALKVASTEGLAALTIGRLANDLKMSKSGLFAHFRSKATLELATIDRARDVFATQVLILAQNRPEGMERLWSLCHFWLRHIEERVFPGSYFFAGALFEYAEQSGPLSERIRKAIREWLAALEQAVKQAQELGELEPDADRERTAFELNGLLVGAHWAHLLGDQEALKEARAAVLRKLRSLATEEIPPEVFQSVRDFQAYLKDRHP
jgi:AcrR family transcriptional regulator